MRGPRSKSRTVRRSCGVSTAPTGGQSGSWRGLQRNDRFVDSGVQRRYSR
jgi:hypothetical protein